MNSTDCTILISTSPIPSHPDTKIIDETISAARFWLPDAPIVIMADGIWNKLEHRRTQYLEYLNALKNRYSNADVVMFESHSSQAKMTRYVLENNIVKTKYLLFNEHDISLRTDLKIDWDSIFEILQCERADVVRLPGFGEGIHPEHRRFISGEVYWKGSHFYQTIQWSQWPHISTKDFYLKMLQIHFAPEEIKMIEERMHSVCQIPAGGYIRIWEYMPNCENKRCFTHQEGRIMKSGLKDPCHWE